MNQATIIEELNHEFFAEYLSFDLLYIDGQFECNR